MEHRRRERGRAEWGFKENGNWAIKKIVYYHQEKCSKQFFYKFFPILQYIFLRQKKILEISEIKKKNWNKICISLRFLWMKYF